LNASPSTATRAPATDSPGEFRGQLDHAIPPPLVDDVDQPQQARGRPETELARLVGEGADVLGQASPAEAEAGSQPDGADPRVVSDRPGQQGRVRPGGLADLGHRVDEGDLRGQECVGGQLDQFGRCQVGGHERDSAGDLARVDLAQDLLGVPGLDAGHDPVRPQRVRHRVPLTQEFRVPGQPGQAGQPGTGQPGRGADRDGGLADDQAGPAQQRGQDTQAALQLRQVGSGRTVGALRRADAQEVHVAECRGAPVRRGEGQAAGGQPAAQHGREPRLVYPGPAVLQGLDPGRVGIDAEDRQAGLGHACRVHGAQVAGTENGEPRAGGHPVRGPVTGPGSGHRRRARAARATPAAAVAAVAAMAATG
jgi:hypothetical protein